MNAFPLGGVITLLILLPNLLAVFFPPSTKLAGDPQPNGTRLQIMTVVERIGQVGSFVIPFFNQMTLANAMQAIALAPGTGHHHE